MFNELNKKNTLPVGFSTENVEYKKLSDYVGTEINPCGYLICTTRYGKAVTVFTSENVGISIPNRYASTFEAFTEAQIEAVLDGHLKLTNIREADTRNGHTVLFDFADC